jgi:hypothetical protein
MIKAPHHKTAVLLTAALVSVGLGFAGAPPAQAGRCHQGTACQMRWQGCKGSGITNTMYDGTLRSDMQVDSGPCKAFTEMQASDHGDVMMLEGEPYADGRGSLIYYADGRKWHRDWTDLWMCDARNTADCSPKERIPWGG